MGARKRFHGLVWAAAEIVFLRPFKQAVFAACRNFGFTSNSKAHSFSHHRRASAQRPSWVLLCQPWLCNGLFEHSLKATGAGRGSLVVHPHTWCWSLGHRIKGPWQLWLRGCYRASAFGPTLSRLGLCMSVQEVIEITPRNWTFFNI